MIRRKTGTATNSRIWNWWAVPGLPTAGTPPLAPPIFIPTDEVLPHNATAMDFRRTLPEIRWQSCLLGWAFGPRKFMKNWPRAHRALRGLTRLPWISGAFCRKFAGSPVCPRVSEPGAGIGFSTLSPVCPERTLTPVYVKLGYTYP